MSKRIFPQQHGERKKAKLDISISDHNFPLSQNNDESDKSDTWGDDNDDEILLLASQACEEVYNTDLSLIPDYSMCMQPGSTSTQLYASPGPSTSKAEFTFKKPSTNPPSLISTHMKEKCHRIASPLPGITAQMLPSANEPVNLSDDIIFNDKIFKGHDSDYVYRQLLQLQEDNAKLKSENGKLLEKCVTKEGEASILRTQLKTCQVAVDNARLEKIKAQEKVQVEWTEKLAAATGQMHDLRTQLDFKNLEIISVKEKCKKLESTKVRMTQVTVANNDISSSHKASSSFARNESMTQSRRVKTSSNAVQTDNKAHFLALNKTCKAESPKLSTLLPYIMEATASPHSLLDYNEKLSRSTAQHKCRVYSTFYRAPDTVRHEGKGSVQLTSVYEDIVKIAGGSVETDRYFNVFRAAKSILAGVVSRLETISKRTSTAFQKEMDEKYIESTNSFLDIQREDLLRGRALYKEEQEILARRMAAILSYVLEIPGAVDILRHFEKSSACTGHFTECISNICNLLDITSCATVYSGLLLSLSHILPLLPSLPSHPVATLPPARALGAACCAALYSARVMSVSAHARARLCFGNAHGNLKTDYDQGVLLFRKESCYLQVLLKQIEVCLKCIERQDLTERAVDTTRELMLLYCNMYCDSAGEPHDTTGCDCQLILVQVIVYAVRICAVMLQNSQFESNGSGVACACACALRLVYLWSARDAELSTRLGHAEGLLMELCEILRTTTHSDLYSNMLSELAGNLPASPEDLPPAFHRQPWLKSFESFSIAD